MVMVGKPCNANAGSFLSHQDVLSICFDFFVFWGGGWRFASSLTFLKKFLIPESKFICMPGNTMTNIELIFMFRLKLS